jgi:hypothetical protein
MLILVCGFVQQCKAAPYIFDAFILHRPFDHIFFETHGIPADSKSFAIFFTFFLLLL